MKIALLQLDIAWENKRANFRRVSKLATNAAREGAGLVCLPELFATGYTMNPGPFAEPLDGETPAFLSGLAREHGVSVVGSFIEKTEGKPRNSAIVFDGDGEMIGHYSKIHLPSFYREQEFYAPGDRVEEFTIGGVPLGILICYDLRFPEIFRKVTDRGVKGIFVIANWPSARVEHWDLLLRARAIENQLFVMGLNRAGSSPIGEYPGHSAVIDPFGRIVASAPEDREEGLLADVDFTLADEVRDKFPVLKDRRFPS